MGGRTIKYMTRVELPRRPVTGAALMVAPVLVLGYGSVRLLGGPDHPPGPVWTVSHLMFLGAFVAFGLALPGVCALVGRGLGARLAANVVGALAGLGVLAGIGQTVIDLGAGWRATDRPGMNVFYDKVYGNEFLAVAFQEFGPILFFVGLPVLVILLGVLRPRRLRAYAPVVVTVGMILPSVDLDLLPVAALLMGAGLVPFGRRLLAGPTPDAVDVPAGLGAGRSDCLARQGR